MILIIRSVIGKKSKFKSIDGLFTLLQQHNKRQNTQNKTINLQQQQQQPRQ